MTRPETQQQRSATRAEVQQAINDAREAATTAARDAQEAARDAQAAAKAAQPGAPPAPPVPPRGPGRIVIPTDGGDGNITINVDGQGIHLTQDGRETIIPIRDIVPRGAVQISLDIHWRARSRGGWIAAAARRRSRARCRRGWMRWSATSIR
jgi:hypothetical protein